jgi:glyoxylase-like metal-dependent hydrolase (beta-lactamase superfamily II)
VARSETLRGVIRVHALDTGRVKIHRRQVDPHPRDALRLPATLIDRKWTDWLSVWSFAIEHPEGLVVVDAGQDPDFKIPAWDLYGRVAVRFDATDADRLDARLREAGLDPAAVAHHVFTHLHVDHVGAGPLPGARVLINADEWSAASAPGARLRGYLRTGMKDPTTVAGDHDLYGDGTIRLLATPGHTAGHQSVLVTPAEGPRVLITGDAVYSEAALLERRIDGVGVSPKRARASIDRLRELCSESPTVVVVTHDPTSARRLAAGQTTPIA